MDFSTSFEAALALRSLLFGAAAAALCDMFRLARLIAPAGRAALFAQDLLLCLLLAAGTLLFVFLNNSGIVRFYILLGAGIGASIWFCTLSRLVLGCAEQIRLKILWLFQKKGGKSK